MEDAPKKTARRRKPKAAKPPALHARVLKTTTIDVEGTTRTFYKHSRYVGPLATALAEKAPAGHVRVTKLED